MLKRQVCAALTLVLVVGVTTGCSLGLMAPIVVEGQHFPVERATQLRAGMSPDQVEALLGTPLRRFNGASVIWRYDFTRRLRECRPSLGPIPLRPARTERHALELLFGSGGLQRAVYREVAPGRLTEQMLVGVSSGAG